MLKWTRRLLVGFNVLSWGLGIVLIMQAIAINTVAHDRVIRGMAARGMPFGEELIQIASVLAFMLPVMIVIVHVICRKLIAIIDSVGSNDVFSLDNAARLRAIGWAMLAIHCAFTRSKSCWSKRGARSMSANSATEGSRFDFNADK